MNSKKNSCRGNYMRKFGRYKTFRNPEESRREFKLVTLGPPSKVLLDHAVIGDENLVGSAVIQRFE